MCTTVLISGINIIIFCMIYGESRGYVCRRKITLGLEQVAAGQLKGEDLMKESLERFKQCFLRAAAYPNRGTSPCEGSPFL